MSFQKFRRRVESKNEKLAEAERLSLDVEEFWRFVEIAFNAGRESLKEELRPANKLPEGFEALFGNFR